MQRKNAARLLTIGSAALIVACGGGSSGAPAPAPAPPPAPAPAPPQAPTLDLNSPTQFDIAATNHSVPFGNGTGVHIAGDGRVLFTYTINSRVHIGRASTSSAPSVTELNFFSFASALGVNGNDAVLVLTRPSLRRMEALLSSDFGSTWSGAAGSDPDVLGDAGTGASVPAACVWRDANGLQALAAWVAPPSSDAGGPMYVAHWRQGSGWSAVERVGSGSTYTAPTLACSDSAQQLVAREDLGSGRNQIVRFDRTGAGAWSGGGTIIANGADPHYCVAGSDAWVGYHHLGSALIGHSVAGAAFVSTELDTTGKFVPAACHAGGHAVVCNGDWDSKADADARAPGRRILCHASHDAGATWTTFSPAPGQSDQNVTSAHLSAVSYTHLTLPTSEL
ncbi:MAG: hypothetical protein N3D71_07240, partial [Burkholderiaceae bacterium]|nr:hypothetical protein [Burkholderiaceae bacterium]